MATALNADTVGPVDVAVVAFEGNRFNGEIAPALRELQEAGTVRVLDLTFVSKDADGSVTVVELDDASVAEAFRLVAGDPVDLLNDEDLEIVAEELPPNSSAAVVVWENTWAARLSGALRRSSGELVMLERVPRDAVERAISALGDN
ncbi:DUF6325 family protein [Streptomyces venezuelae]|uniref:DUF6325 family protein n=1 Tax=Streptomyces venezuelae TaxID=54571 RepID=UPI00278C2842|nr:DUF6325 family protein [Streptomyces venezuelae]